MLKLLKAEYLKNKGSSLLLFLILGTQAIPYMMFVEALQGKNEGLMFTISNVYSDSILYIMLIMNLMLIVILFAYVITREFTENTWKNFINLESKSRILIVKYLYVYIYSLFLIMITWIGLTLLLFIFTVISPGYTFDWIVSFHWLGRFLIVNSVLFLTVSPIALVALKSRGMMIPMVFATVVVMANAALSNHEYSYLFPWTFSYHLVMGNLGSPYSLFYSYFILVSVVIIPLIVTGYYFKKLDV